MQLKLIAVTAVLLLMVASVSVCGCPTDNTNHTPSASPFTATSTVTTTAHDALLERYLTALKNESYSNNRSNVTAWDLAWINSTSARLSWTQRTPSTNTTLIRDDTYITFPTTQEATVYLNAMDKTAYNVTRSVYEGEAYQEATGHAPQVYQYYGRNEGKLYSYIEYRYFEIEQLDNIILTSTMTVFL